MTPSFSLRTRADLLLILVCFIWGSTFVVVKDALTHASAIVFLTLRFAVATVALALIFRRRLRDAIQSRAAVTAGVITGVFLFLGFVLQTSGLRYTSPSKSAFLTGLCIVLVPMFSAVFERKRPGISEVIGVALATGGMALMTLRAGSLSISLGDLLTIGCAVAFAMHILLIGHYVPKYGFQGFAVTQMLTAAVLSLATFRWIEPPVLHWTPGLIAAVIVTGLFATAFAFSAQSWAQQYTTSTRTALIFAMEPVFAWLTSFVLAAEGLTPRAALGGVLILGGVLFVELKPVRFRD